MTALCTKRTSQKEQLRRLLFTMGTVTMGYLADNYPHSFVYHAVQRFWDLKQELLSEGYTIQHIKGQEWRDNAYKLVQIPKVTVDMNGQRVFL